MDMYMRLRIHIGPNLDDRYRKVDSVPKHVKNPFKTPHQVNCNKRGRKYPLPK